MSSSDSGKTTKSDAARIQSTQAKAGNDTGAGTFPARAQAAADKNINEARDAHVAQVAEANAGGTKPADTSNRFSTSLGVNKGAEGSGGAHRGGN